MWLGGFIIGLLSIADYWEYEFKAPDVDAMLTNRLNTETLKTSLEAAIASEDYDEARSLIEIGQNYNHALNYPAYQQVINQRDTASSRLTKQVSGFAGGFLSGKAETAAGVAGALTSDFTVVGDLRDLNEQYSRYQQGLPVNELVATLAGVGVGLTAATVGTLGVAAPVKVGTSTLKLATRMNRLTRSFRNELMTVGSRVFNWKDFLKQAKNADLSSISRIAKQSYNPAAARQIGVIAEQANGIRKNTSMADSIQLLKYVENTRDLNRVHRLSQRYGIHTRGVLRLLGKTAVRGVKALRITLELLISILATFFSAMFFVGTIGGSKKPTT
ncbi:hypothetical protein DKT75_02190 [Leucothrix arctica]|uniref:Uncharacterized protein n=2 Tax=Leucothrix arctica TaxID=1481894 RepID=A0A317CKX8_9GAMM|nr:hypothetical protein DKT75_02190 [Leucothrix arctica]